MKTSTNIQTALDFEGMTNNGGLVIMDLFLKKAKERHPEGLCFEFGAYKGRTAALIAGRLGEKGWLHVLEQADYLELEKLKLVSQRVTWHKLASEQFCINDFADVVGTNHIVYSHHDASHFFSNVQIELTHMVGRMADYGVIVLDDFNDTFPQVRAAYYHLRYACEFPFELLLTGFNKAILVHQDKFDYFESYVLNELLDELEKLEFACRLCRTDISSLSRNFFLQNRLDPDADKLYGTDWWGERFYQPSRKYLEKK